MRTDVRVAFRKKCPRNVYGPRDALLSVGRAWWKPLSLRERAGIACVVWSIALFILAVAAAIPGGPTAALTADDMHPIVSQSVHFDASASVGHDQGLGRIVSYRFDFGDGAGTANQIPATAIHVYPDVGAHRATVTVRDARGNEGTASLTIDVRPEPTPTGPEPDLTPSATSTDPASPLEGQVVSVSITIVNHGGATAESATIDVYDERPNGTTVAIGQVVLGEPLATGASTTVYSQSFLAVEVGEHTIRIVIGNVTPTESNTSDNSREIAMTVRPSMGPGPTGGEVPLGTWAIILALLAAGIAALIVAATLLRRPRKRGPLEPPPVEPQDQSPPPLHPR